METELILLKNGNTHRVLKADLEAGLAYLQTYDWQGKPRRVMGRNIVVKTSNIVKVG